LNILTVTLTYVSLKVYSHPLYVTKTKHNDTPALPALSRTLQKPKYKSDHSSFSAE